LVGGALPEQRVHERLGETLAIGRKRVSRNTYATGDVRIRAHRLRRPSFAANTPTPIMVPVISERCVVAHSW
jgi:hypothetical protein